MSSRFVDTPALKDAALRGMRTAFLELRKSHPDEQIYGFGFYSHEASYITTSAFTEQGLDEVTKRYVEMGASDDHPHMSEQNFDVLRRQLRWSPADSPRHLVGGEHLAEAEQFSGASLDTLQSTDFAGDDDAHEREYIDRIGTVYDTLLEVLRTLDVEGLFGPNRDEIVLSIWEGDQSSEDRIAFAKRCNSPEVAARFEHEELTIWKTAG